ncbi:MAG: hypothetical protein IJ198_15015, partial [Lachnospiraceae bacterium]|nr:hypothetical protein [Lachnospiraceae bacterium]
MKQPTDKRAAHLVISLGGSGADMLREVKGLIGQNCCSDDDRHKAPERVAYVAFDTDVSEKEKRSGRETGQAALEEDEITILAGEAAGVGFAHLTQEAYPWIYRWLDPEILHMAPPYNESGAGGVRQVGRLLLFLDLKRVIEKLRSAITDLAKRTGVESITIHILSGISGGTGSGMFLDMAYIVRQVAEEIIGAGAFRCTRIRMIAYLLMPDVNLRRALEQSKPMLMRNAGAALQELDHAMRLGEIGEYYECRYSAAMSVKTDRSPFDYVYLISAGPKDEDTPEESYRHSLRVAAEHILALVSGKLGEWDTFLHSVFSNLGCHLNQARECGPYKERSACYLSLGYDCREIAADKLTRYIFTNLFEKVGDLVGNEPEQEDVYNLLDSLGLGCDRVMMELLQEMTLPLNPREYTGRQLFGKDAVDMIQVMPFFDESRVINNIFSGLSSAFEDRLREEAANAFLDIDRGPVWASHVLVSETSARFNALDRLITEEKNKAIQYRESAQQAAEDFLYSINKMREDRRPRFLTVHDSKKCAEYINAWNNYFRTSMEVYCYDLLIGREDTLESIGRWGTLGFYDDARDKVEKLRDRWLSDASRVLEEVSRVVRRNTDEFRSVSAANETHGFIWSTGDIPNPEEAVNALISENGTDRANIIRRFLEKLFDNIDAPSQIGNFRKFMEEFLQQHAQGVFDASPEDLLRSSFDEPESLAKSVERDLLPYMNRNAKPRFDWEGNTSCYRRILMIPGGCEHIEKGAREYIGGQSDIGLKVWNLRGRISMGVILANLSLHNYFLYQECERQICLDPNARGLFLNQGSESYPGAVNNMKDRLPSVIPSRKRTAQEPAPEPIEKFERDLVMELREMRKGEYPFLHFEKTSDWQDFILYINLSASLDQSGFYDMTGEENYQTAAGEPDADKLKELIERLKEIRYKTGLPETTGLLKRLIVCENILSSATQEMKDRYLDLLPDQEEAVKEEVAWEVAEWYYVSTYSFYMKAREEKAKYDEIEEKIRELEGILEEFEVKKAVKEEPVYEAEPEVELAEEPVAEEEPVYEAEPEVKLAEEPEMEPMAEEEPVYEAEPEVKLDEEPVEEPEVVPMAEEEPVYGAEPEVKLAEEPEMEPMAEEEPVYEAEPEV